MSLLTLLLLVAGGAILVVGAELLVRGSSRLAVALGVAPLVVGLTVVAWGTSAPEAAVSLQAALSGSSDLAFGNVVGSNVFNVLVVLGLSAVLAPLVVERAVVRRDVPVLILVSAATWALAGDGLISRAEGLLLFVCAVVYTAVAVKAGRLSGGQHEGRPAPEPGHEGRPWLDVLLILAGLALLVVGSRWLVTASVVLARFFGASELVIGLTVVAAGTSLPEVAASAVASIRGHRDIAVGNVVGSCISNLLIVLGLTAALSPSGVPIPGAAILFDTPVMVATAVACLPIFVGGRTVGRWEGLLFLGVYGAYVLYLVLRETRHGALPLLRDALIWFFLPLTAVTLCVTAYRALRDGRRARGATAPERTDPAPRSLE